MTQSYREFARVFPELADGSSFSDWLDALQNAGVAVHCRARVVITITEKGLWMLRQLEQEQGVSYWYSEMQGRYVVWKSVNLDGIA